MLQLVRRYRELLVVAVLLAAPLLLFLAGGKEPGSRNAVDRAVITAFAPVQKGVFWTVHRAQDLWYGYLWLVDAREENARLKSANLRLKGRLGQVVEIEQENERLRGLLGFRTVSGRRPVAAPVIAVGANPALARTIRIGRGRGDGVEPGHAVVTPEGVVGRVIAAGKGWADVMLLSDPNSSVAGLVGPSRTRATVRGTGEMGLARLDNVLRTDALAEGDLLVTAGTGGIFPKGVAIGRVSRVERKPYGLFQAAALLPVVDLSRLEEVLVLVPEPGPGAGEPALAEERLP